MNSITPNKTLDCTGLSCPMPIVKTNRAIKDMAVGETLEVVATDSGAMLDMQAWAKQTQHELLRASEENGRFRFLIRKTH